MAATSDSDSSSSSSSSSDDEESLGERGNSTDQVDANSAVGTNANGESIPKLSLMPNEETPTDNATADGEGEGEVDTGEVDGSDNGVEGNDNDDANYDNSNNDNSNSLDSCKVFLSRIPQTFTEESITRLLEEKFGDGCVEEVSIVCEKSDEDDEKKYGAADREKEEKKSGKDADKKDHRGFGFATFSSQAQRDAAIEAGTVRGSTKSTSKRKHTLYIRPVVREDEDNNDQCGTNKNLCFLWKNNRCPYGEGCKFVHEGDGGCLVKDTDEQKKKKQKCFVFKKSGKCKLGDECPYSHDFVVVSKSEKNKAAHDSKKEGDETSEGKKGKKDKSLIDCINWKNKGKCRKGPKCPFRHDEAVRDKVMSKKNKNKDEANSDDKQAHDETKPRQSLSIRVFGLNYDTTEADMRHFFKECGPIMEVTFPTFEDSGRSKGYCGVLFTSPKAVAKAVALDGQELEGRWLSIQEGKMYLRKWEEGENSKKTELYDERGEIYKKRREEKEGGDGGVGEFGQRVKKRKKHGFKE